jgi:hypothetical protein
VVDYDVFACVDLVVCNQVGQRLKPELNAQLFLRIDNFAFFFMLVDLPDLKP